MPFVSKAQRSYLEIHHPEVAKEYAAHTSAGGEMSLPEYVKKHHPDVHAKLPADTQDSARAVRCDVGKLAKAKRTSQGYARVDARLTRTGILEYARADGGVQREYRPAEEVFKADSLASLTLAPVTDLHPSEMLTPANHKQLSIGVTSAPRQDGQFVAAELVIQDGSAIQKIDAGERAEISCGYTCELDWTPGVYQGQRYDAVQRNIEYNHVAIGPRNWGRAGSDVALRLDSADALISRFDDGDTVSDNDNRTAITTVGKSMTIKINGVELKLDERDAAIVEAELARLNGAVKDSQTAKGAADVELASLKARCDAAEARIAKLDRADLEQGARAALGAEFKFDGLTDAQVRAAVVAKVLPAVRLDGASEDYVRGAYGAALSQAAKAADELRAAGEQSGVRKDNRDPANDPDAARAERVKKNRSLASS